MHNFSCQQLKTPIVCGLNEDVTVRFLLSFTLSEKLPFRNVTTVHGTIQRHRSRHFTFSAHIPKFNFKEKASIFAATDAPIVIFQTTTANVWLPLVVVCPDDG